MKPQVYWLGIWPYQKALAFQQGLVKEVQDGHPGHIIGVEHPSVITLGKRGSVEADLQASEDSLKSEAIEIAHVDRGGQATLHAPGQLVIYLILPIKRKDIGVRDFVCSLEEATLHFLKEFGINATRKKDDPGLYTDKGKIAFFGLQVSRGVTFHGISINVNNDLGLFSRIRSCGQNEETFDSLSLHGVNAEPIELYPLWLKYFLETLS